MNLINENELMDHLLDVNVRPADASIAIEALAEYAEETWPLLLKEALTRVMIYMLPGYKPESTVYARTLALAWAMGASQLTGHKSIAESAAAAHMAEQTLRDMIKKAGEQIPPPYRDS